MLAPVPYDTDHLSTLYLIDRFTWNYQQLFVEAKVVIIL